MKWIQDLFMIEREAVDRTPEDRLAVRLERSKPILDDLRVWIAEA